MKICKAFALTVVLLASLQLIAQQPVNVASIAGSAAATGNGTNTGALRVAIASDNTGFAVNATLSAETTKVIGVVRTSDGAGNLLTSNSTTFSSKFALDGNLLGTLGTAFSTAGKVDVKAADGDVFVRSTTAANFNATVVQATGTNLHIVCDSGCGAASSISLVPQTTGGLTLSHTVAAASTNATSLKASAGQVYEVCVNSNAAYPVYHKLYNKASAPAVGTDTPVMVIEAQAGVPACKRSEEGFAFGTGIAWALTKGITDADATAVLISDATVEIAYK
jgi:hypothetical protein